MVVWYTTFNGVQVMWCLGKFIHWRGETQQGNIYLQMLGLYQIDSKLTNKTGLTLVKRGPKGMNWTSKLGFKYI
jgi:hypothetical protein